MIFKRFGSLGPGILVTAAFIGPGTITTATLAGANYGYVLLWALLFATAATIVLQEMTARLGTVSQQGLAETLAGQLRASPFKWPLVTLIMLALYGGNAAYEAGNLAGATLGIQSIFGDKRSITLLSVVLLTLFAAATLLMGRYRIIERVLIGLVMVMALSFIATFLFVEPDWSAIARGLFTPTLPSGSVLTVVALIGTTVVPYNLFLHASAARTRWAGEQDLALARSDTILSIGLGGLVTILIVSTAAASLFAHSIAVNSAADMAVQFEPLFGKTARILMGVGLFAAGLSSAITAPLATAYATTEILGLQGDSRSWSFRLIALSVLFIGATLALTGIKPITLILMAQFANGLILPVIAGFLLWAMNNKSVLGTQTNGVTTNVLGGLVIVVTAILGARSIGSVFGLW